MVDLRKILAQIFSKKQIFLSISTYVWAAVIPAFITILINPLIAKNLSATDFAILGYYSSFNFIILPFVSFSFISYYSRNYFLKSEEERQKLKDTLITSSLIFGIFLTVVCLLFYWIYYLYFAVKIPLFPYVVLSFFANIFGYYLSFYQTEKKLKGEVKKFFWVSFFNILVFAVLSILFVVVIKGEAYGRLFAVLLANIFISIYCISKLIKRFEINWTIVKDCLSFTWPIVLSSMLFYGMSGVDKVMLEKLNNDYEFGLYNIATQIVNYFGIVGIAVLQTFSPDIFRLTAQKNYQKLAKISIFIFLIAFSFNLLFIPFSKIIISLLTAGKFTQAYHYADIIIYRNISYVAFFLYSDILIGLGLTKFDFKLKLFFTIIAIFVYYLSIKYYSFVGAAWAQSFVLLLPALFGFSILYLKKQRV